MKVGWKMFILMFSVVTLLTGPPAIALVNQHVFLNEGSDSADECIILPQDGIYHADHERSLQALRQIKDEFEEVLSIFAQKHNVTIIRIIYTEPNEYRDPISGCIFYSLNNPDKIHQTGAR